MTGRFYQAIHAWCPWCGAREIFTVRPGLPGGAPGGDLIIVMHELSCPDARDCQQCGAEVHPAGFVEHYGDCPAMWTDTTGDDYDDGVKPSHWSWPWGDGGDES